MARGRGATLEQAQPPGTEKKPCTRAANRRSPRIFSEPVRTIATLRESPEELLDDSVAVGAQPVGELVVGRRVDEPGQLLGAEVTLGRLSRHRATPRPAAARASREAFRRSPSRRSSSAAGRAAGPSPPPDAAA